MKRRLHKASLLEGLSGGLERGAERKGQKRKELLLSHRQQMGKKSCRTRGQGHTFKKKILKNRKKRRKNIGNLAGNRGLRSYNNSGLGELRKKNYFRIG